MINRKQGGGVFSVIKARRRLVSVPTLFLAYVNGRFIRKPVVQPTVLYRHHRIINIDYAAHDEQTEWEWLAELERGYEHDRI